MKKLVETVSIKSLLVLLAVSAIVVAALAQTKWGP